MGLSDDGDDPVAPTHTRCPCARVRGSDHDFVTLVVPGGVGFEAHLDFVGVRACDLAGPVQRRGERRGPTCEELVVSLRGLPGRMVPDCDDETDLYSASTTCCACFRMMILL